VQWDNALAGAKQEGKVVVNFTGGTGLQKIANDFEDAFPGINAEATSFTSANLWVPRVTQEWQAGIYTWDVSILA
jgi:hypothetical protein